MNTTEATKRHGILYVSLGLWEQTSKPETPDEWHTMLLLPDNYEIERIERTYYCGETFALSVLTDALPESDAYITQVEIVPIYNAILNEDGCTYHPELVRIDFKSWDGEQWKTWNGREWA